MPCPLAENRPATSPLALPYHGTLGRTNCEFKKRLQLSPMTRYG